MRIDALLWDAGGTLFDTYPAVVAACQTALEGFGVQASSDWLMGLFRTTTANALRTVAATYGLAEPRLRAAFETAYDQVDPALEPPFPGVVTVCAAMQAAGGQNFIVTHRSRASLVQLLEAHAMTGYFVDCITKEDPYPRKPDPASLLALAARRDLRPERCLVIGDRDLDIVAGQRAGMRTCYFGAAEHTAQPDLEVETYATLLRWLQTLVQPRAQAL